MSRADWVNLLYIIGFALFCGGLHMVRGPRTAVRGNLVAAAGMAIALIGTLIDPRIGDWVLIVVGVAIGTAIGIPAARNVKMTAMPQMVALFNGVGGGAVALISLVEFRESDDIPLESLIPIVFAAIIGSISFWGSNIAFSKLQELAWAKRRFPARTLTMVNIALAAVTLVLAVIIVAGADADILFWLLLIAAGVLGICAGAADRRRRHARRDLDAERVHGPERRGRGRRARQHGADRGRDARRRVRLDPDQADGRGDEPLDRQRLLRRLRRRRRARVAAATTASTARSARRAPPTSRSSSPTRGSSSSCPGYGMAVAQAQRAVADLAAELEKRDVEVLYAIHPVAGRMPGHMNVLLAEADVPYDKLKEMDDINGEFARTDVALVIGANDVTNPAARNVADSPIYGMPILDVDKSSSVVVLKRSMASGFAGIDNPLFYDEKTVDAVRRREGLGERDHRRGSTALTQGARKAH